MRRRRKLGKLPPPFPNGWFAILESCELKKEAVREVYALGESLYMKNTWTMDEISS